MLLSALALLAALQLGEVGCHRPLVRLCPAERPGLASRGGFNVLTCTTPLEFVNEAADAVTVFWVSQTGLEQPYFDLAPGERQTSAACAEHAWRTRRAVGGGLLSEVVSEEHGGGELLIQDCRAEIVVRRGLPEGGIYASEAKPLHQSA